MEEELQTHSCAEHLNGDCVCTVCGSTHHLLVSNSAGTGSGRVEVWCVRCGAQEIYYDDTGTVLYSDFDPEFVNKQFYGEMCSKEELNKSITNRHNCEEYRDEKQHCMVCGRKVDSMEAAKSTETCAEKLFIIEKDRKGYLIRGFEERSVAEKLGLRHLTVIIVPFIIDGAAKGRWIVHDRTAKQWAKRKNSCLSSSLNLFGGHCAADADQMKRIGEYITEDIFVEAAERELEEELLRCGSEHLLEIWDNKDGPSGSISAARYQHQKLIPIGYVTYSGQDNNELSYLYALPVPAEDVDKLLAADNYEKDGMEHDILLPIMEVNEAELRSMHRKETSVEICDAITRLWLWENRVVYRKLRQAIQKHKTTGKA